MPEDLQTLSLNLFSFENPEQNYYLNQLLREMDGKDKWEVRDWSQYYSLQYDSFSFWQYEGYKFFSNFLTFRLYCHLSLWRWFFGINIFSSISLFYSSRRPQQYFVVADGGGLPLLCSLHGDGKIRSFLTLEASACQEEEYSSPAILIQAQGHEKSQA